MFAALLRRRLRCLALALALLGLLAGQPRPFAPAVADTGDTVLSLLAADLCSVANGHASHGDAPAETDASHCVLCFATSPALLAAVAPGLAVPPLLAAAGRPSPPSSRWLAAADPAYLSRAPPAV